MPYTPSASAGDLPQNRFEFTIGDEVVSLPKLEFLPYEADEYLNELNGRITQRNFILGLIDATDEEVGAKYRASRPARDQVIDLYGEWEGSSEVTVGKSEDSSPSSASTESGSSTTS